MKRGRFSDEQIVRILPFQFRTLSLATGCGVLHPLQYLLFLPIFVILPGALGRPILAGYSLSKNPGVPIHLRRGKPCFVPGVSKLGKLLHGYLISREECHQVS